MLYGIRYWIDERENDDDGRIIAVHNDSEELQGWCDASNQYGYLSYAMVVELPDIPGHICVALLNLVDYLGERDLSDLLEMNRQQLQCWLEPRMSPNGMSDAELADELRRGWRGTEKSSSQPQVPQVDCDIHAGD